MRSFELSQALTVSSHYRQSATYSQQWCLPFVDENEAQSKIDDEPGGRRADTVMTWAALGLIGAGILGFASRDQFFMKPRCELPRRSVCISNLKNLEGVKATWALENHKQSNSVPTDADLFGPALYIREKPQCPGDGIYTLGAVSEKPRCSIRDHTL
jgi:hypothetical protein